MEITFWGVRGSYPVPGRATVRYGGQTSCVEVRTSAGTTVIPVGANPETSLGRAVTLVVVLGGLTVFGVFVGTISASVTARLSGRMGANDMDLEELTNHVVVCGWNRAGKNVLRELLVGSRAEVVLVTEGAHLPDNGGGRGRWGGRRPGRRSRPAPRARRRRRRAASS